MQRSTKDILRSLSDNAKCDFDNAQSLPPAIYHDQGILDLEVQHLFRKEWICLGRLAEIPESGDYLSRTIIDTPVIVIRQRDGAVRAFANICRHRSAKLLEGDGHVSRISCPYHSWTYDIDGQLVGAPFMTQTAGFSVGSLRLKTLSCDTWQGFVYVSLDPGATSFGPRLSALTNGIRSYRMADYVPVFSCEETWATNWKCLVENYMDAYHVHRVHRNSFGKHGSSESRTHLFDGDQAFTYHYVDENEGPKAVAAHPDNTWLDEASRHRTYLINVFPCHTMQLQPDLLWYLSILPHGLGSVNVRWAVSVPAEILAAAPDRQTHIDETMRLLKQVNSEDMPIVENVYRTTKSPDAGQGRLSFLERNVWQFGRYLARTLDQ